MNQITEFFKGLFSTSDWPARWNCGYWSDFHGWLYIISDLLIWLAYFLIPLFILNYFNKKKEKIRFQKVYLLFAGFILLCGTTHFMDAMMFWIPMYRMNGLIRVFTAGVSLLTVYYLVKMLPELFFQKTNVELETEIGLRKEAESKLEKSNEGLQLFASMASHDLQEPLRKISVLTSLLEKRNKGNFDEKSVEFVQKVLQSSESLQIMINEILTMSLLDIKATLAPVDLNKPVNAALENLELIIKEKKANIIIDELPVINGHENYLVQLFYNLIGNALKFCDKTPLIKIYSKISDNYTWINVTDNGIGMGEEDYLKIFETFKRLNAKTAYEGNGLGLAICKRIVEIHNAHITVKSKPNEGTTFSICFPSF